MSNDSRSLDWKSAGLTGLAGLVGLAFLAGGGTKLAGMAPHPEHFAAWGFPAFFLYVVGLTEVVAGGMLFSRKTRFYGALALGATMVGAVGTHLVHGDVAGSVPALVLGAFTALLAWTHRPAAEVGSRAWSSASSPA